MSQTISKLEDELGETLFERSSRDGAVTDAGALLLKYAEELLNLRGRARDALRELRELQHGKVSIAANEFTVLYLLVACIVSAGFIQPFTSKYSGLSPPMSPARS